VSFVFPHPFMPPAVVGGFAPPPQVTPAVTIDLTEGSQKRPSIECVAEQSKPNKKKKTPRKKVEIVELDDTKDDVDLLRNAGHWKDHWVIQLVTIRGEMQNTFSSPPKQGQVVFSFHFCDSFFPMSLINIFFLLSLLLCNSNICRSASSLHSCRVC
jgi:hypothetical protein